MPEITIKNLLSSIQDAIPTALMDGIKGKLYSQEIHPVYEYSEDGDFYDPEFDY